MEVIFFGLVAMWFGIELLRWFWFFEDQKPKVSIDNIRSRYYLIKTDDGLLFIISRNDRITNGRNLIMQSTRNLQAYSYEILCEYKLDSPTERLELEISKYMETK